MTTGIEFDRSLRAGAAQGQLSFPKFGRLLAATQDGGATTVQVDPAGGGGAVIGIFVCRGAGPGLEVSVVRDGKSLLWFKADGCNPGNMYSGQSEAFGAGGVATLKVTAAAGTTFALVLEQVAPET